MRNAGLFVVMLAVGCGPNAEGPGLAGADAGPGGGGGGNEFTDAAPQEACEKMDILFVIDDSGSMAEEQDNLIANFPGFAQVIESYVTSTGESLDYRIAITTAGRDVSYTLTSPFGSIPFSEAGANGAFVSRQDCGMSRRWIEKGDPDVSGTFSCAAFLGTHGPGAEMPLLGLEWSLSRRMADGTNSGFLREDALLAIVMVTDQDDCSREDDGFEIDGTQPSCFDPNDSNILPLEHYLTFLDDLKGGRGRWATAVIAGTGPGACESSFGRAAEATRMIDFVGQVGTNSVLSSICDGDLAGALDDALDTFDAACNSFPPVE